MVRCFHTICLRYSRAGAGALLPCAGMLAAQFELCPIAPKYSPHAATGLECLSAKAT